MDDVIRCKCGKSNSSNSGLTRHVKTDHVPGVCKECGVHLPDKLEHRGKECSEENKSITYKCEKCGKEFKCKKNLGKHMHSHTIKDDTDYIYRAQFPKEFKLDAVKMVAEKGLKQTSVELKIQTSTLKNWVSLCKNPQTCQFCGKVFPQKSNLELHVKRKHESPTMNATPQRNYEKCFKNEVAKFAIEHSSKEAVNKYGVPDGTLRKWVKLLLSPLVCDKCGHSVALKCDLEYHMQREHNVKTEIPKVDSSATSFYNFVSNCEEKIEFPTKSEKKVKQEKLSTDVHNQMNPIGIGNEQLTNINKNYEIKKGGIKDIGIVDDTIHGDKEIKHGNEEANFINDSDSDLPLSDEEKNDVQNEDEYNTTVQQVTNSNEVLTGGEWKIDVNEAQIGFEGKNEFEIKDEYRNESISGFDYENVVKLEDEYDIGHSIAGDLNIKAEIGDDRCENDVKIGEDKYENGHGYIDKDNLQNVVAKELTKASKFQCPKCGFIPPQQNKKSMKLHMNLHRDLLGLKRPFTKAETVNLTCTYCDKKFKAFSDLQRHIIQHTGERTWQCEVCAKSFGRKDGLTRHMLTHSDSQNKEIHICNICGKEMTSSRSRNIHEMSHLGQFLYHCEECNKGFNEKSVLEKHKVKKHGGSYSHFCDTCGQGFMLGRSLNAHIGNCGKKKPKKKPNLSTHPCTVCEKIFNRKCNLERHMKMHSGVKEYSCDQCGKKFTDYRSLSNHTNKKHESENVELFTF